MGRWTLVGALAVVFSGCAKDRIKVDALAAGLERDPGQYYVVDVRSEREFRGSGGHIAGATHLPWPKGIREDVHTLDPDPEQTVVLVCFTGHRSRWGMQRVREALPENEVVDLQGGMMRWWGRDQRVVVEPVE